MRGSITIAPLVTIIAIGVIALATPANAAEVKGPEDIRQDLYDFVAHQEQLLNTLEQIQTVDPHLRRNIATQMQLVSMLKPQHLIMLGQSNLQLDEVNGQLSSAITSLEWSISNSGLNELGSAMMSAPSPSGDDTYAAPAPVTAGASQLDASDCPNGKIGVGGFAPIFFPPGYCNQSDSIPVNTLDANGLPIVEVQEFLLSDVEYPFICPINILNSVVLVLETAQLVVKAINDVTDNVCQQEAAGFNGSTACIVVVLGLRLAEDLLEQATECNGERRDSEGTAIYTRSGEIFVQSTAHYASLIATDQLIKDAVTLLDTNIGGQITTLGNEVTAELNDGFGDLETQVRAVEQRVLENAERTSFVNLNNEVIEYKIWCDKQRPTLRPSNCP